MEGEIRKVNPGYARNFLIPNKLARIRRGKQSGSIAAEAVNSTFEEDNTFMEANTAQEEQMLLEERTKKVDAARRKKMESIVRKLTSQVIVR